MFKKENGITLVALIVTIIVLLLLAGIILTISLRGDDIIDAPQENDVIQVNEIENVQTEE